MQPASTYTELAKAQRHRALIESFNVNIKGPAIRASETYEYTCLDLTVKVFVGARRQLAAAPDKDDLHKLFGFVNYIQMENHKPYRDAFLADAYKVEGLRKLIPCDYCIESKIKCEAESSEDAENMQQGKVIYTAACRHCLPPNQTCSLNKRYLATFLAHYTTIIPAVAYSAVVYLFDHPLDHSPIVERWTKYFGDQLSSSPQGVPRPHSYSTSNQRNTDTNIQDMNAEGNTASGLSSAQALISRAKSVTRNSTAPRGNSSSQSRKPDSLEHDFGEDAIGPSIRASKRELSSADENPSVSKKTKLFTGQQPLFQVQPQPVNAMMPSNTRAPSESRLTTTIQEGPEHQADEHVPRSLYESVVASSAERVQTLQTERNRLREEVKELKKRLEQRTKDIETQQEELEVQKETTIIFKEEADDLRKELGELQAQYNQDLTASNTELDSVATKLRMAQRSVDELQRENYAYKEQLNQKASELQVPIESVSGLSGSDIHTHKSGSTSQNVGFDRCAHQPNVNVNINLPAFSEFFKEYKEDGLVMKISAGGLHPVEVGFALQEGRK